MGWLGRGGKGKGVWRSSAYLIGDDFVAESRRVARGLVVCGYDVHVDLDDDWAGHGYRQVLQSGFGITTLETGMCLSEIIAGRRRATNLQREIGMLIGLFDDT